MRGQDGLVLAGVGLRRQQNGPVADLFAQIGQRRVFHGQGRRVRLQAAGYLNVASAQDAEPFGDGFVLRQHDIESAQERGDALLGQTPAFR